MLVVLSDTLARTLERSREHSQHQGGGCLEYGEGAGAAEDGVEAASRKKRKKGVDSGIGGGVGRAVSEMQRHHSPHPSALVYGLATLLAAAQVCVECADLGPCSHGLPASVFSFCYRASARLHCDWGVPSWHCAALRLVVLCTVAL
eukprot:1140771-Pelagomonas_calceolata.AAC.1